MKNKMPFERLHAPEVEELNELLPQYSFIKLLSVGGMGAVYQAEHKKLGGICAVKILPRRYSRKEGFVSSFESEARMLANLVHENLVAVYDFGVVDQMYFLSMEYIEGCSLHELATQTKMSILAVAKISRSVASGLMHSNGKGVVHRDVNPSNVIIQKDGGVKLIDFGIAKFAGQIANFDDVIWGKVGYSAPEVTEDLAGVDEKSDIFALGCLICFCVTGYTPDVLSLNGIDVEHKLAGLYAIVNRSTKPAKDERFKNMKQMYKALKAVIKTEEKSGVVTSTGKLLSQMPEDREKRVELRGAPIEYKKLSNLTILGLRGNTAETGEIVISNRYILRGFVKSLPIGAVYFGYDQTLERKVVITLIHAEQVFLWREGFMSIASGLSALEHPNIPRTVDAGISTQGAYIVSQYVGGENLYEMMAERKMSVTEVMECTADIFSALNYASHLGFNNQMISPESILSYERPVKGRRYFLSNMGIGRIANLISLHTDNVSAPVFDSALLAPELIKGEVKGEATTVYMIGNLVYYLLASGHPYAYLPHNEAYQLHCQGNLPDIRTYRASVPEGVSEWIKRCIEVNPKKRFQSLNDALEALRNALKEYRRKKSN